MNNEVVVTVVLIKRGLSVFELSKMAVTEKYKGLKIGLKLMIHCIDFAKINKFDSLFLELNTS